MGRKKKPFIDKKNASTYHLLHRSQRDVGGDFAGEGTTNVILWPSPDNDKVLDAAIAAGPKATEQETSARPGGNAATFQDIKEQMAKAGLVDDYDYEKHLRPITGSGRFFGEHGEESNALSDPRSRELADDSVQEVERQLESVVLTADCMDEDVAEALFGNFDDAEFEELADDFFLSAAQEPEPEPSSGADTKGNDDVFDYDAHIQSLLQKAAKEDEADSFGQVEVDGHDWAEKDMMYFAGMKELDSDGDGDEGITHGAKLSEEQERALCERFEATLAEYDSDEVGELASLQSETKGAVELDTDELAPVLDGYLESKDSDVYIKRKSDLSRKGSGFHVLQQAVGGDEGETPERAADVIRQAKEFMATPELDLPPEEILIDGQSYFSARSRNEWDCESILSTYSNLDNNPVTIGNPRRKDRRKKKNKLTRNYGQSGATPIILSNKTGLPKPLTSGGDDDDHDHQSDCDLSFSVRTNATVDKRPKGETLAAKKARKQAARQMRVATRIQKKMVREAFAEETARVSEKNSMSGLSVFKC